MCDRALSPEPRVYAEWTRCPLLDALSPCKWTADSDTSAEQGMDTQMGWTASGDGSRAITSCDPMRMRSRSRASDLGVRTGSGTRATCAAEGLSSSANNQPSREGRIRGRDVDR